MKGRIINLNGGVYKVILDDGNTISVKARGKLRYSKQYIQNQKSDSKKMAPQMVKLSPKVGDIVTIENDLISSFETRKNSLIRPDIANVDQILLVFAAKDPDFSFLLLDLFIINIIKNKINPVIVVTKKDKLNELELNELKNKLSYYNKLGYDTYFVNSLESDGTELVDKILDNKITILAGQTGAGKSSLINALIPGFNLETQEISEALGRGKHTTREISLYPYKNGYIGDTPGFSKLDLLGIELKELKDLFVEFKDCHCKFNDCMHQEKSLGCQVIENVNNGNILKSRYDNYIKLYNELKNK